MNEQEKIIQNLFDNLDIYYNEEQRSILDKLKFQIDELNNIIPISNYSDLYSLVILIQEIKIIITENSFDEKIYLYSQKVNQLLDKLYYTNENLNMFENFVKELGFKLLEYKNLVKLFFDDKKKKLENIKSIDEFVIQIKSSKQNTKFNTEQKNYLKNLYIKYSNNDISEDYITDEYKSFFLKAKQIIRDNSYNFKYHLPLCDNPIMDLLIFHHFIQRGVLKEETKLICDTDLVFLKAYSDINISIEIDKLKNINNQIVDLKSLFIGSKRLKQVFDYGIFSISQYFSNFDLSQMFNINNQESKDKEEFTGIVDKLILLPKLILNKDEVIEKSQKGCDFFTKYINTTTDIAITPKEILKSFGDLYFHQNLKIATYINLQSKSNNHISSTLSRIEKIYNNIEYFIKEKDKNGLGKYIQDISGFIIQLDSFYKSCLKEEYLLHKKLASGDLLSINLILERYKEKTYKNIIQIKNKANEEQHIKINNELASLEKAILNHKTPLEDNISDLSFSIFEYEYQSIIPIISFADLPPISHTAATIIQEKNNECLSIKSILELNDNYWRSQ